MLNLSRNHSKSKSDSAYALILASLFALSMATSASAQIIDIPAIMNPDLKAPPTSISVQYAHQFKSDVEDAGTEMARDNAFFSMAHRVKINDDTAFFALGSYTLNRYNFSSASGNAYQWDDVHRMVIGGLIGHDLNDRWRLIGGGVFRSFGEGGADYGDSITGGLMAGFDYHPSEDFSIGLIFGAFSALEDSVGLLPVPTMKWNFAEGWRWNIGLVTVADPGIGTEVSWQAGDNVQIGVGAAYQTRRYRLNDKIRVPGAPARPGRSDEGGIGQETELPVFALVSWTPRPKVTLDLQGGVAFAGNIRLESDDGGYITDDDYDPAPFVAFKARFMF